jgi:hypothetical protein
MKKYVILTISTNEGRVVEFDQSIQVGSSSSSEISFIILSVSFVMGM